MMLSYKWDDETFKSFATDNKLSLLKNVTCLTSNGNNVFVIFFGYKMVNS